MSQIHKHSIPANIAERCLINPEQYQAQYQQSVTEPDAFWGEQGKILDWIKPYTRVKNTSFAPGNISIKWYEDGTLNLAANCLDRHLAERGDQTYHHLGRRRCQPEQKHHLSRATSRCLPLCQRPARAGH
ncbi:acetyl-coenzyme A synthetase N-terminal domain-containing protein [Klebsiella michiganensis]|nr:acetyl-coenzyme A synthetase N-terminal domain-containing protein [Klebsiella michiganensis]